MRTKILSAILIEVLSSPDPDLNCPRVRTFRPFISEDHCDQIGRFLKVIGDKF